MKQLIPLLLLFLFFMTKLSGQSDTLSLLECLRSAQKNAVINSQFDVVEKITDLKIDNANATNLPKLSAYGKAWYQSDAVTVITPAGPGIEIDRFQYNAGLEADQKLFDGGLARGSRELAKANGESELRKMEMEKYSLNNQVCDLFFEILLIEKKLDIIRLKDELLQEKVREMTSAFENGMLKQNDLDKMKAELLLLTQQQTEIEKLYMQTLSALAIITGLDIPAEHEMIIADEFFTINEISRPEYRYYESETQKIENLAHLQKARNYPKLYAYGQAGYSYPGLNFFENQSDYYYIIGAKLSWIIFDWKQTSREAEIVRKQKEIIHTRREDFDQKMAIFTDREIIEQLKLREMILLDEEIIRQRQVITKGSANTLVNGVNTSSGYLEDLNAEIKARLDYESHKLQLQSSLVRQKLLKGISLSEY